MVVYLFERRLSWIVDVDDRHVSQEAVGERLATGVCGRVTSPHELDPLQTNPGLVAGAVEPAVLHQLAQERDDSLRAVLVHVRQVDLVTKQHKPLAQL